MADRETITLQIQKLKRQLETLKHTKRANLAAQIYGGIQQLLWCRDGDQGANVELKESEKFVALVMADPPPAPGLVGDLPSVLADPQQLQTVDLPSRS